MGWQKMNRLYINGRCLERELTGVERYTIAILLEFDELVKTKQYKDLEIILLTPVCKLDHIRLKNIKIKHVGRWHGVIWEQIELPIYSHDGFLLSLHSIAPLLKRKQIMVMHDAKVANAERTGERTRSRFFYYFLSCMLGKCLHSIIAITNYAKQDIHQGFHIPFEKIHVILSGIKPLDAEPINQEEFLKRVNLFKYKYVLAVGGGKTKNNETTAQAVEQLKDEKIIFVLAGFVPDDVIDKLRKYSKTRIIGRVTDAELVTLYQNATCLSFPSLVEGFGAPPVEAMIYGCPVIVSRCEAIPEVCGDAALYLDCPHDPAELACKIAMLKNDDKLRNDLINKGYENIKRFSWRRTAEGILQKTVEEMTF